MKRQLRCALLAENRSGVTSLLFAIMMVPLILILGLAIDFGFYIDASSKLDLAADAAAMHAVRAASMAASNGTTYQNAGLLAGEQWFAAQAEVVPGVALTGGAPVPPSEAGKNCTTGTGPSPATVTVTVCYTAPTYTATVTYTGTTNIFFSKLVGISTWPIAGTATSTITNSFVDFGIMIDNSQSMLIGATTTDITTMNENTPCAQVTANPAITDNNGYPGLSMQAYSYFFNGLNNPYGQGPIGYYYYQNANGQIVPQTLPSLTGPAAGQQCDPKLIGGCAYPASIIYGGAGKPLLLTKNTGNNIIGACNNGGGAPGAAGPNTPQAPCAFACHQNANGGDYYAEARKLGVTLRLDIVQQAAQNLLTTMQNYSKPPQTLLNVGIYTFNSSLQPVYPCTSLTGCASPFGDDLGQASKDIKPCTGTETTGCLIPPITLDKPNTYFPNVFAQAAAFLAGKPGDGLSQATAYKNLFIITDGVSDWNIDANNQPVGVNPDGSPNGGVQQAVGPLDQLIVKPCDALKNAGFTIYVLYTPYQPLPTWTYSYTQQASLPAGVNYYPYGVTLQNFVTENDPTTFPDYNPQLTQPDTPIQAALRACATNSNGFYTANDSADINNALQQMLATALNSAARVTN